MAARQQEKEDSRIMLAKPVTVNWSFRIPGNPNPIQANGQITSITPLNNGLYEITASYTSKKYGAQNVTIVYDPTGKTAERNGRKIALPAVNSQASAIEEAMLLHANAHFNTMLGIRPHAAPAAVAAHTPSPQGVADTPADRALAIPDKDWSLKTSVSGSQHRVWVNPNNASDILCQFRKSATEAWKGGKFEFMPPGLIDEGIIHVLEKKFQAFKRDESLVGSLLKKIDSLKDKEDKSSDHYQKKNVLVAAIGSLTGLIEPDRYQGIKERNPNYGKGFRSEVAQLIERVDKAPRLSQYDPKLFAHRAPAVPGAQLPSDHPQRYRQ